MKHRKYPKYSDKWFEQMTLEEVESERENIRSTTAGNEYANKYNLLRMFDNVIRKRMYGDQKDSGSIYPRPREHGWSLWKDDD